MPVEIKLFKPEMWQEFRDLVQISYGLNYWMLDKRYFDWWYHDSPQNWDDNYRVTVVILDNKIVGFVNQIANSFWVKGKTYRGTWYTNGMIHPDYRGHGLGTKVYDGAKKFTKFAAVVSFNTPAGHIFNKIGFNTFNWQRMKRAIYILNQHHVRQLPCFDNNLLEKIINHFPTLKINNKVLSPLKLVPPKDEITHLWSTSRDRYLVTTERNYEFLVWRYQNHPRGKYLFFTNYDNKKMLNALVIARVESQENLKFLRIVDIFGKTEGVEEILTNLLNWAKSEYICLIDFFCTNWPDYNAFIQNNFLILEPTHANFLPYLFNPIEMRKEYHEMIGIWAENPSLIKDIRYEDIYFVRGDADRDRPH